MFGASAPRRLRGAPIGLGRLPIVRTVVVFTLLGSVCSFVSAQWAAAVRLYAPLVPSSDATFRDSNCMAVWFVESGAVWHLACVTFSVSEHQTLGHSRFVDGLGDYSVDWDWPRLLERPVHPSVCALRRRPGGAWRFRRESYGWPLPCFSVIKQLRVDSDATVVGGVWYPEPWVREGTARHLERPAIPLTPIGVGCVVDVAFWSSITIVAWSGQRAIRRRCRCAMNRCSTCGYSLHNLSDPRCPECGAVVRRL